MTAERQRRPPEFKTKIALAALKEDKTLVQLSSAFGVSAIQISQWKKQLLQGLSEVFQRKGQTVDIDALTASLYQEIGRLKMEFDRLKKNQTLTLEEKRTCVDPVHPLLSIRRQCDLLGLKRSSFYYTGVPATETPEHLAIMELIDKQYTSVPIDGSRWMTVWLRREGHDVNRKGIQRLTWLMGFEDIAQKPGTSKPLPEHEIYPYLLRNGRSSGRTRCGAQTLRTQAEQWFHVPGGCHRLVQPLHHIPGVLQHPGWMRTSASSP